MVLCLDQLAVGTRQELSADAFPANCKLPTAYFFFPFFAFAFVGFLATGFFAAGFFPKMAS